MTYRAQISQFFTSTFLGAVWLDICWKCKLRVTLVPEKRHQYSKQCD